MAASRRAFGAATGDATYPVCPPGDPRPDYLRIDRRPPSTASSTTSCSPTASLTRNAVIPYPQRPLTGRNIRLRTGADRRPGGNTESARARSAVHPDRYISPMSGRVVEEQTRGVPASLRIARRRYRGRRAIAPDELFKPLAGPPPAEVRGGLGFAGLFTRYAEAAAGPSGVVHRRCQYKRPSPPATLDIHHRRARPPGAPWWSTTWWSCPGPNRCSCRDYIAVGRTVPERSVYHRLRHRGRLRDRRLRPARQGRPRNIPGLMGPTTATSRPPGSASSGRRHPRARPRPPGDNDRDGLLGPCTQRLPGPQRCCWRSTG